MSNAENNALANEIISRLNEMVKTDVAVARAVGLLIGHRVELPDEALRDHTTIQVGSVNGNANRGAIEVGFLGLLNGLIGAIPDGKREGWGYVSAIVEQDGIVSGFVNTNDYVKVTK